MLGVGKNYYSLHSDVPLQKKVVIASRIDFPSVLVLDASLLLRSRPLSLQSASVPPCPFSSLQFTSKPTTATACPADRLSSYAQPATKLPRNSWSSAAPESEPHWWPTQWHWKSDSRSRHPLSFSAIISGTCHSHLLWVEVILNKDATVHFLSLFNIGTVLYDI